MRVGTRVATLVTGESPAEDHPAWPDDLKELAGGRKPVGHADAVHAAGYRVQRGFAAHPLHVPGGIGEVGEDIAGGRRDVQGDFNRESSGMTGSRRVEPVIEAFMMAGQLTDLDGAALAEQRAAAS